MISVNVTDVEARWRPLTSSERTIAETLIGDSIDILLTRWPSLEGHVDSGSVRNATVVRVVANMVRRAMLNRDAEGVSQIQDTTGPFSQGVTYANPNNNLYLSADEVAIFDLLCPSAPRMRNGWLA